MATIYKVLGQSNPTAGSLSVLYQVPAATSAVCSTLVITGIGVSSVVRVAIQPASASIQSKHYIVYDATVNQFDSTFLTMGVTLAATDVVSVYSNTSSSSFSLFGSEIT
jgi:hypothetical protein